MNSRDGSVRHGIFSPSLCGVGHAATRTALVTDLLQPIWMSVGKIHAGLDPAGSPSKVTWSALSLHGTTDSQ